MAGLLESRLEIDIRFIISLAAPADSFSDLFHQLGASAG